MVTEGRAAGRAGLEQRQPTTTPSVGLPPNLGVSAHGEIAVIVFSEFWNGLFMAPVSI